MAHPNLPRHIAIILDGNGRWASTRGLPRPKGHEEGLKAVRLAVRSCRERGIPNLTLYAFSVANWARPKDEIDGLMRVCLEFAESEREECIRRGVAVQVIGDLDELPTLTRRAVEHMVEATRGGTAMTLALALSYGGRRDMVNAMRTLAARAQAGLVIPEEINEASLRSFLTTSELPDPDLIVRTGGEKRLSDFLLYESAYAELFFSDVLWPDFDESVLDQALAAYGRRQRRYGRTGEQAGRVAVP
ncbi:polyprenyl diphosphate synthase [Chondromyces crocatus]|uniref:Isoprenyl transferase n=1 Tax=Chondromyces crocatus TaxID=52 RepID=A0A0K1EM06_CHOCO|nr:polyprenyl diphosphate synthase [Chondromyces crocatus]AKT41889.1 UDP pyrophosphate synthase [Chondromyces crocatus]